MDYDDRGLAALPKLVGGPKYSRPPGAGLSTADRPPDPDDLPLVAERTPEEDALAAELGLEATPKSAGAATAVATAPVGATAGYATSQARSSWSVSSGTSASGSLPPRRGLGGLFRSKNSRSGAG